MKRKIIEIDEQRCTGCGLCVTACAEGALEIRDGVAKVIKEDFCDGLGACIGDCPEGALRIIEREAPDFDPNQVEQHLARTRGAEGLAEFRKQHGLDRPSAVKAGDVRADEAAQRRPATPAGFRAALAEAERHAPQPVASAEPLACGCPGTAVKTQQPRAAAPATPSGAGLPAQVNPSDLGQWPVQLHLVPPRAPFFQGKELVVLSTCGPVASADVHWRFLRGRAVVVACPKLDRTEPYVEKLAGIFASNDIPRVIIVRMEVPCCGGLTHFVHQGLQRSGRTDLIVDEVVVGTDGAIRGERRLHG
jgi:NAD-dependent dihydropyrimidine dehydrogenase PreA subunit